MKRNENENFEDYKLRLKAAKAELRAKRKGVWKTIKTADGEELEVRHAGPNRRARREDTGRLFNNSKGIQLVVVGNDKYRKEVQVIPRVFVFNKKKGKMQEKKVIHSVLVTRSHSGKVAQPKSA